VGPDYTPPDLAVPDAWHAAAVEGLAAGEASLQTWWTGLGDPVLEELIGRAEAANLDLRLATTRIREARARLGVASGQKLPDLDTSGSASRSDQSDNSPLGVLVPGGFDPVELYDIGFDASWEIDLFGRIRRSVESAGAAYEASIEDYRDVLVTLFAEVARTYVQVRELQARVSYAEANAEAQRATLTLTRDRYEAGATSEIDVAQAESNLKNTEAAIPALQIALRLALNRLAVLLGEPPGALDEELGEPGQIPEPPADLVVGVPAELLRQRPDLRGAERRLAAQTARIGIATADLYPRFSLSGFFAVQATDAGDLLDGDSTTWGISLPFRWNLFAGGRIRSAIEVEEALTEQALVAYERAVLFALEEVENSLTTYALERQRRDRLAEAVAASQRTVELAEIQYRAGLTDFQNVLDSQRFLAQQQDFFAASEGQMVQSVIALYKALGGGWDPDSAESPADGGEPGVDSGL
jgi:NodT family efflux transporter outer membrane factor (OMF) lipoprotein